MIRYADITINDRNPVKRYLQRTRLRHSLKIFDEIEISQPLHILDFGSGNGELCKYLSDIFSKSKIYAYEPAPELRAEAQENLKNIKNATVIDTVENISEQFDVIFCLEVLEHLPEKELNGVLDTLKKLAKDKAIIIIGVPNEIYLPALIKGLFRMTRRYGDVDAVPSNIFKASAGIPPGHRPVSELSAGLPYIFRHMGFDYRELKMRLQHHFHIRQIYGSPLPFLPLSLNFEIYFICLKQTEDRFADSGSYSIRFYL